ncbi:hypothetical protein E2C01_060830 [Portunus trituberculatus]|uniref:Uncharacterized protein n=1 Tax=Portunus trituberculatus TaxID=210409 RepID=A0A5B7HA41_PORTR|nr:hypothetical protein [Portunus trituberculatus]
MVMEGRKSYDLNNVLSGIRNNGGGGGSGGSKWRKARGREEGEKGTREGGREDNTARVC